MTAAQEKAINKFREDALHWYSAELEVKFEKIIENEFFVSYSIEVGQVGDEGTWAAIGGRDHAHIFVGKKGGITYPVSRQLKNSEWKHTTRWLSPRSLAPFLRVCSEQR